MEKINGMVKAIFTSKTEKEGKDGQPKEEEKKQITIRGVGDDEGIIVVIQGQPEQIEGFRLDEEINLKFNTPQTRLTEPARRRIPVEEGD